jgi:flavin-dependent dehydrogenase
VVEFAPGLMGVQLDDGGSRMLRRKIEALGVRVHTGKATKEIVDGEDCRLRMNFADGSHLETDLIVFSAGIRPHDRSRATAAWRWRRAAASWWTTIAAPVTPTSSRSANAPASAISSTGWSRRAIAWRRPPPASSAGTSRYSRAPT